MRETRFGREIEVPSRAMTLHEAYGSSYKSTQPNLYQIIAKLYEIIQWHAICSQGKTKQVHKSPVV